MLLSYKFSRKAKTECMVNCKGRSMKTTNDRQVLRWVLWEALVAGLYAILILLQAEPEMMKGPGFL